MTVLVFLAGCALGAWLGPYIEDWICGNDIDWRDE